MFVLVHMVHDRGIEKLQNSYRSDQFFKIIIIFFKYIFYVALHNYKFQYPYLSHLNKQCLQNLWPHSVCRGSFRISRQIGHSYFGSGCGTNWLSYPSVWLSNDDSERTYSMGFLL